MTTAPHSLKLPMNIRQLPAKGRHFHETVGEDERARLAEEHGLIAIDELIVKGRVQPWRRNGAQLVGVVRAKVTQPCAASGEPLQTQVDEAVELHLVPDGSKLAKPQRSDDGELVFDAEGDDLPETFSGDVVDVAPLLLEYFTLGLDPHLRLDGAVTENLEEEPSASPFAVLASLREQ